MEREVLSVSEISKLRPHVVQKVWGGSRLASLRFLDNLDWEKGPVGETWEISRHPSGSSWEERGALVDRLSEEQMPYLVKLIDTSDFLSVQVHPNDEFARLHESSQGKTECWLILEAEEGAGVYLGFKPGVSRESFEKLLREGEGVDQCLVFHKVKRGDFFFVPAGCIHAIGSGVFLTEVQQSSGVTYRVWDWNRADDKGHSRELHIDKAMQVIQFGESFNQFSTFRVKRGLLNFAGREKISLVEHPQFDVELLAAEGEDWHLSIEGSRQAALMVLEGSVKMNGVELKVYESCLLSRGEVNISGNKPWVCLFVH